jgi:hypothetical protein
MCRSGTNSTSCQSPIGRECPGGIGWIRIPRFVKMVRSRVYIGIRHQRVRDLCRLLHGAHTSLDLSLEGIHRMLTTQHLTPSGMHITQSIFFLTEGISIQKDQ